MNTSVVFAEILVIFCTFMTEFLISITWAIHHRIWAYLIKFRFHSISTYNIKCFHTFWEVNERKTNKLQPDFVLKRYIHTCREEFNGKSALLRNICLLEFRNSLIRPRNRRPFHAFHLKPYLISLDPIACGHDPSRQLICKPQTGSSIQTKQKVFNFKTDSFWIKWGSSKP